MSLNWKTTCHVWPIHKLFATPFFCLWQPCRMAALEHVAEAMPFSFDVCKAGISE